MLRNLITILFALAGLCLSAQNFDILQERLDRYVSGKQASIGICVIADSKDTVSVNSSKMFPMMSVFKFPAAMAFSRQCQKQDLSFEDSTCIDLKKLPADTYSPMLKDFCDKDSVALTYISLLDYSLSKSDNNACDIILEKTGGPEAVDSFLDSLGFSDINILWTEDDMHKDMNRFFENNATPVAMACLLDYFDTECNDPFSMQIKTLMENCKTGTDRLAAPLQNTQAVLGHKTGTGGRMPDGKTVGINDAGYVHLPDGRRYVIAVFITDSDYTAEETSAIIAGISETVYNFMLESD